MPYSQQLDTSPTIVNKPVDQMHQTPIIQQSNLMQPHQPPTLQNQPTQQPQQTVKKNVTTLTKQQADELRMISKTYQVGKNELSMIINFMSGNRNNPNTEDIVRVKLGEKREYGKQPDGQIVQVISDGWYQMDYRTGESFHLTTNRRINPNIPTIQQPGIQ